MSSDATASTYRSAAEMSAAGIDLYPVGERAVAKVADRSSGAVRAVAERAAILADPGFGRHFTDHLVRADWSASDGWSEPELLDYANLELDPAAMFIHYGQSIFEGLKAYRHTDGSLAHVPARGQRRALRAQRPPPGHGRAAGGDLPGRGRGAGAR